MIPREVRSRPIAAEPKSTAGRDDAAKFIGAVLLPLTVFAALAVGVGGTGAIPWDTKILRFAERHYESSIVDPIDLSLKISLALGAAIVTGGVILRLTRRRQRYAFFWALAVGGVLAVDLPLKEVVRRPAAHGAGYSFPSGNAMASAAILAAMALTSSRRWRRCTLIVGVPVVIAYGVALVYAWWHYPSDVVGGWCFAFAWVMGWWLALRPQRG